MESLPSLLYRQGLEANLLDSTCCVWRDLFYLTRIKDATPDATPTQYLLVPHPIDGGKLTCKPTCVRMASSAQLTCC